MADQERIETSLGERLKDARAIKHWTIENAEAETNIRARHLSAIEEGKYHELPPDVFAVGFVRRYARALGLNPEAAAVLFREERAARRGTRKGPVPFGLSKSFPARSLVISSRTIIATVVAIVVLFLFGYIWYQVRLFAAPPQLSIAEPATESVVEAEQVTVTGKTSPTATLFINGEPVPLDEQGVFRQDVRLTLGVNTIEVKAVNRLGKEAMETLHILFEPKAVETNPSN